MNKYKVVSLILLALWCGVNFAKSQSIKVFQGAYDNGTATYEYFENAKMERIYHGIFKYKGILGDGVKKLTFTANGQFTNDKKDGTWTYILKDPDLKSSTETVTGSYANGFMEGNWNAVTVANNTKKVLKKTSVFFKKNKLIGELRFDFTSPLSKDYTSISVKGNFSDSSLFDGAWSTTYAQGNIQYEELRKYKNGVLFWLMHRRLSDGKILEKIDSTYFVDQFFQNYDPAKKMSVVQNQKYVYKDNNDKYSGSLDIPIIATKYWTQNNRSLSYYTIASTNLMFLIEHGYESSPVFYERSLVNWKNTREGEKELWQQDTEAKLKAEKYQSAIEKGDMAFKSKQYAEAITLYKAALVIKDDSYPRDQMQKAQQIIDEDRITREQEQKAKDKSYLDIIAKADEALKNKKYDVAAELFQSSLSIKDDAYPKKQIEFIKQVSAEDARLQLVQGMERLFVTIEGGQYKMGCMRSDVSCIEGEFPEHEVSLATFQMTRFEITNGQYKVYCKIKGLKDPLGQDSLPVTNVKWTEAVDFASWLGCRLPTEAEWEYAARGGIKSKRTLYSGSDDIDKVAWFYENSAKTTHSVGSKKPNTIGVYDMSGNVWEWCSDFYGEYSGKAQIDPKGPSEGTQHVKRGGSFNDKNFEIDLRVTNRASEPADFSSYNLGFRLVKKN